MALVNRYNEISERFAEPMEDEEMTKLLEEQGELQARIDAVNAWDVGRKLEVAADALRLPPWDADVTKLSGGERRGASRSAACSSPSPTCCCSTSRPITSMRFRCSGSSNTSSAIPAR